MYADAPGSDVSTSVHLVVSGRTLCGVRLRQPTDPSTDREGRPIRRPPISYTYQNSSPEIASCAVCRASAGLGPWGGDFVPKRYLAAATAALAVALALTACSDHDEGADLPDRLEFTATGTSAEGPGAEVICGGVGMPWALTISGIVEGPVMIASLRTLGDYTCERDGLAVECQGAANGGAAPTELSIALSEDGRSGAGRYAFEGSASVRCSANFDLVAR